MKKKKLKKIKESASKAKEVELRKQIQENKSVDNEADRAVPPYPDYMTSCMFNKKSAEPSEEFDSILESSTAEALCQCQFEHFPKDGTMSTDEFYDSAIQCKLEQDADYQAFSLEYLARVQHAE